MARPATFYRQFSLGTYAVEKKKQSSIFEFYLLRPFTCVPSPCLNNCASNLAWILNPPLLSSSFLLSAFSSSATNVVGNDKAAVASRKQDRASPQANSNKHTAQLRPHNQPWSPLRAPAPPEASTFSTRCACAAS